MAKPLSIDDLSAAPDAPPLTEADLIAAPDAESAGPTTFDKLLKVPVDAVTGLAGAPVDMFTLAMKVADLKNELAAKVGNMVLGTLGAGEPLGAIDTMKALGAEDGKPVPGGGEWLREKLPEGARGATAETPMGRAAQEVGTFALQNVLSGGGLRGSVTSAILPGLASSAAGEVDDSLRLPAVVATELLRGKASGAVQHARDVRRVLEEEPGLTLREASRVATGKRAAGGMMTEALGDDAGGVLDRAIAERSRVRDLGAPGHSPMTATVTDNPKLAATQQAMESGLVGQGDGLAKLPDAKTDFMRLRVASNEAVRDAVDSLLVPSGANKETLRAFAQSRLDDAQRAHDDAIRALEFSFSPSEAPEVRGERIRQIIIGNHRNGRAQASRLYDAHLAAYGTEPVSGAGRMIDVLDTARTLEPELASKRPQHIDPVLDNIHANLSRQVREAVDARLATEGLSGDDAAAVRDMLTREATESMTIPYEHAVRYHQELGKAANDALVAGQNDKARRLNFAQDHLRDVMDNGVADPQLQEGLREASAFYRDFINRFSVRGRPGMQARGRAPNSPDAPLIRSGVLPEKMFVAGPAGFDVAEETARALQTLDPATGTWVTDPAQLRDLQDAAFDRLVQKAHEPGSIVAGSTKRPTLPADKLDVEVRRHADALRHPIFAPVRDRLRTLMDTRAGLEARAAATGRDLGDAGKTVAAAMLGLDDSKAVAKFLAARPADRRAMVASLDREARAGLRKLVLDDLMAKSSGVNAPLGYGDTPVLHPDKLLGELDKPGVREVFDPPHLRDARTILKSLSKSESARRDSSSGSRTTPLKTYQDAIMKRGGGERVPAGLRHLVSLGFGSAATAALGPKIGPVAGVAAGTATGIATDLASGAVSRMRDVSKANVMRFLADAISDPEKARAAVRFIEGDPKSLPLVRHYLYAAGDLYSRDEPKSNGIYDEETIAYPSSGFDDTVADFGSFSNPQPAPLPLHSAQMRSAETKRADAAVRSVTSARNAAGQKVDVSQKVARGNTPITTLFKAAQENRARPYAKMVDRYADDLPGLVAVLEELKPEERQLVQKKAETAVAKLMSSATSEQRQAYMPRLSQLFVQGDAGAAAQ